VSAGSSNIDPEVWAATLVSSLIEIVSSL